MLVGKFALSNFSLKKETVKATAAPVMKFSVETTIDKVSPYGDIFERYGNND
jgi:hypothetical protein